MIRRIAALLLAAVMLLSLTGCQIITPAPSEPETTPAVTEPTEDEMEHFDLSEIDLEGIGELFVERGQEDACQIRLDGLCTPVVLELEGTGIVSISAYGITVRVDPEAEEYASIYGNLRPEIYEHNGLIFLNVWYYDIGYSCVLCPNGTYMETFPDEEYSVMIYVDGNGQMCQSQFAMRFVGIEQWDTGAIDMATSRNNFYYSIDYAQWSGETFSITDGERYTISDCFDLDEMFNNAKDRGVYPDFDTLDELLAYNAERLAENCVPDESSAGPDSTREEIRYFDQLFAAYDYNDRRSLLTETFYTLCETVHFVKSHDYDENNREIAGSWSFQGEEAYRYTNTYDQQDRLTETRWYRDGQEVERFTYTYDKKGGHTETFSQNGEKKYTYAFNENGELTEHTVYQDGKAVKTKDVKNLVKTELLTDIWLPIIENEPQHYHHYYNGSLPAQEPREGEVTVADDGSYVLIQESVDEEDGEHYQHEYRYDTNDNLLQAIHRSQDAEYLRDEYQYDSNGLCVQQTTYLSGEKDMTCKNQYNQAGQLIRRERTYTTEQSYYICTDENGESVEQEVTYTVQTETYRYNDQGLLVETVTFEDGKEAARTGYDYDENGYVLPRLDTYEYIYNAEGVLTEIWLIYQDWASGAAQLRSRTVYVTPENARQLQQIMLQELSWF